MAGRPAAVTPVRAFSGGFFSPSAQSRRIRRIMALAGMPLRTGWPGIGGKVAVWGRSPYSTRGERVAARSRAALVRLEDAFLRSVMPGRMGEPPLGLLIDHKGVHFDPRQPSDLEALLATHPFDDHVLIARAGAGIARLKAADLSKYNAHDPHLAPPPPGYVLVIDQVRGDASLRFGGLDGALGTHLFREMLVQAQLDHPGARIVIRTHPETRSGHRPGHFNDSDAAADHISISSGPISPWALMEGAIAVYTVSSQLGFEAILAGHRPHVLGLPFYAGWGLTQDSSPHPRRTRKLTRAQLFAGAMLLYPKWYDPNRDCLCSFEDALDHLEALVRVWREDHAGYVALDMRLWKRAHLQGFFGAWRRLRFAASRTEAARIAPSGGRGVLVWGSGAPNLPAPLRVLRVEDGLLRSRGLGAALTPPVSLVRDDLGIYYDPRCESRLERLIAAPLPPGGEARAVRLIEAIRSLGLSKYNLGGTLPELPRGHRILVPGQVEDDASIRLGAGELRTNLALLQAVRAANPDAVILYKPHPDVEAGLRPGALSSAQTAGFCDAVLPGADPAALLGEIDEVWTITSTLGFEALLRGVAVTTFGAPFYAGWGLTRDLGAVPDRRQARPSLAGLVHATLIGYPRYVDPVSRLPCPVEVAIERLAEGRTPSQPALRALAKLQGALAGHAWLWR